LRSEGSSPSRLHVVNALRTAILDSLGEVLATFVAAQEFEEFLQKWN